MRNLRRTALSLVLAVALLGAMAVPAFAANPVVSITVSAQMIAITNSEATWAIGVVAVTNTKYFSADNSQDDDYSQVENTGNVAVDIQIQGTDFEGGDYDWTLAAAAGNQTYSLHANSEGTPTVYDVEVKSSSYGNLTTGLAKDATYDWSMKFVAPDEFHVDDDGESKAASVTLVASKAA